MSDENRYRGKRLRGTEGTSEEVAGETIMRYRGYLSSGYEGISGEEQLGGEEKYWVWGNWGNFPIFVGKKKITSFS